MGMQANPLKYNLNAKLMKGGQMRRKPLEVLAKVGVEGSNPFARSKVTSPKSRGLRGFRVFWPVEIAVGSSPKMFVITARSPIRRFDAA